MKFVKNIFYLLVVISIFPMKSSHAYNCGDWPDYLEGSNYYEGDIVTNVGQVFQCNTAGWCSQGGVYAPGEGWASAYAWNSLGVCSTSDPLIEFTLTHPDTAELGSTVNITARAVAPYSSELIFNVTVDDIPATHVGGSGGSGSGGGSNIEMNQFYTWPAVGLGTHTVKAVLTGDSRPAMTRTGSIEVTGGSSSGGSSGGSGGPVYCESAGGGSYEYIANVKVANLDNASSGASPYTDYTEQTANLSVGSNAATLSPGFTSGAYPEHWAVWIDFNGNGDFSDPGEKVVDDVSGNAAVNANVNVPGSAAGVTTRMRISMKYNQAVPGSCGNLSYGEVEDYTVSIAGG